jgi:hypothetical protein
LAGQVGVAVRIAPAEFDGATKDTDRRIPGCAGTTQHDKEHNVSQSLRIATLVSALVVAGAGAVHAQGMLLDYAADRVIQKYQTSTCDQLKQQRTEPRSDK